MIEEPPVLTIVRNRPRPTEAQIAAFRGISTGYLCDAMAGQGALDTDIAPVGGPAPGLHMVGPALVAENGPADIMATLAAIGLAQPGDVVLGAVSGFQGAAAAGDLVMAMLKNAGAAGFVTDGPMRDLEGILEVGLPAWCTGLNPNSPYGNGPGRVGGAAMIGGVRVATGDIVVADSNGVVVVPRDRIDAVIAAVGKVRTLEEELETKVRAGFRAPLDLETMVTTGKAVEVD